MHVLIWSLLYAGRPGNAMILERDRESKGWKAYEGKWDPVNFEFERLRECFKCPEAEALEDGSFQSWLVNRAEAGAEPDWGTSTMCCLSHWEPE